MNKVIVWYRLEKKEPLDSTIYWYLSEEEAKDSGWIEVGKVETYEGSNIHKKAVSNGY